MAGRRARRARRPRAPSQHFLRSTDLAAAIVRDAGVGPGDYVVDLGAGTGRLTQQLARAARRVLAIELDPGLAAQLRGRWQNVEVIEADAVTAQLPREPFQVVANLPFDRTNEVLRRLFDDHRTPLVRADLIVQWGVAVKRGLPWPSTFNGVVWGALYEIGVARRLPREAFDPPPSVDAGVLVFRRRSVPLVPVGAANQYRRFVARGFRHGLGRLVRPRELGQVAPRSATARELDAHQWAELFLRSRPGDGSRSGGCR